MRALYRALTVALTGAAMARCGNLEVTTGFLLSPRNDDHSFCVRTSTAPARQNTSSTPAFRNGVQGRLSDRHALLDPAADWSASGWDFGQFVPRNLESIAGAIRERFQARPADFVLPVVISARNRLTENLRLVREADVIVVEGEARSFADRTVVVREKTSYGCALALERFAGCLVEAADSSSLYRQLAPLVFKPAPKSSEP